MMLERSIFMQALVCQTVAERTALLDEACAHDPALRQRVEALLHSHDSAGSFLGQPVPARLAGQLELPAGTEETQPPQPDEDDERSLEFLAPSDSPGSLGKLGHYEVQEVIGRGGMGIVLRAFDERLHRVVAIKVMAAQLATSATARKRFIREARTAAAISHDHIVTIHAVEEANGLPYIAMHYVAGQSLQQRLDQNGPLELPEILRIGMQTAVGLAAAHAQGLIHRDIKPANILLENGVERVKITDFGLARAAADASLTQTGTTAGTPQYMAPEQARGENLDARTDLFGLGSVLYAMCTGRSPFRGSNTLAVLKRVCEEMPSPIRETNPAIPDFLVAIVARLQAKNPAERYQSAAEVAEVLNGHLAQLQQPSAVGQAHAPVGNALRGIPSGPRNATEGVPYRITHRWAIAAAALLCAALLLGLAEAGGVTKLTTSVIRVLTPQGTLIIEVDDPGVKVTVEGDGGLVITGAGPREVRLPAGKYTVRATKDGQPVQKEEVVSIIRGGEQTVRVLREPPAESKVAGTAGAFVLQGGTGVAERKFDTLAEAVQSASGGDTIEIRGNEPFVSDGVTTRHPLVIRAGKGYTPSITLSKTSADTNLPLVTALDALVLEGLELRRMGGAARLVEGRFPRLLSAHSLGALHVANCRLNFKTDPPDCKVLVSDAQSVSLMNSVLSGNVESDAIWYYRSGGRYRIQNCVSAGGGIGFSPDDPDVKDVSIRVRGNTLVGSCLTLTLWSKPNLPEAGDAKTIRLECSANVASWEAATHGFLFFHQALEVKEPFSAAQAEAFLPRLIRLDEKHNLYRTGRPLLRLAFDWQPLDGQRGQELADWDQFWGQQNTGSVTGDIRFHGGDLFTRARSAPETLSSDDFRLRPDSAGYRAGPDGKDLGADVDLVGPGPAYERWKKTPEYQDWLKETGQKE